MLSFFKKPESEAQPNEKLRNAEQALHDRANRLMRQSMRVDWTPPPMRPTMTQPRAIADALHGRK